MLVVKFDNEKYLTVAIGNNKIIWDVVSEKPSIEDKVIEKDIYFEFSSGKNKAWDIEVILDKFINKQIAISPSDQYLYSLVEVKNICFLF